MQHDDGTASYRDSNRAAARLALWTLAWVATLAVARFGPEHLWDSRQVASWVAVIVNVLAGAAWIIAFMRFMRALDDLWRKIVQDALATALGVGWVAGFGYLVADAAGLVAYDLDIALFPALLGVAYLVAVVVGWIRYR
ncbi:hypothetical protein [Myceligenerans pegani]|uniref:Uncharacterized protein n=1 Tax=Myceligenerans pegani TaxID=2776917 RepID=A0ABR9N192_9MICO|nr:hypothetical protein [Myceligenerans sp. TRM 65318]MBE1877427.1 hypothetical protein [Myceligenerans sp. TRM 65318]MBE3019698.1 hypothetical protein [Myceligenerans sp. TRM 65318]